MLTKQNDYGSLIIPKAHQSGRDPIDRFKSFVKTDDDCWVWFGHSDTHQLWFSLGLRMVNAKRWLIQRMYGIDLTRRRIFKNKELCDNQLCLNPAHHMLKRFGYRLKFKPKPLN